MRSILGEEAYWAARMQTWKKLRTMREVILGEEMSAYLDKRMHERWEEVMSKKKPIGGGIK